MIYIKLSPTRLLEVSEYWILFPLILKIEIAIVVKVKKNRAQKELESEELKINFVRCKIFSVAIVNIFSGIFVKGGTKTETLEPINK